MSNQTDLLAIQFKDKLKGPDPIETRLTMAKKVFISYSIPMLRKEEVVLFELCNWATDIQGQDGLQIVRCLQQCLESKRMMNEKFSYDFGPDMVDCFNKMFSSFAFKDGDDDDCKTGDNSLQKCAIALLSTPSFDRWFNCDITNLCHLLGNVFSCRYPPAASDISKLVAILSRIGSQMVFKEDMRSAFLESTFIPLCGAVNMVPEDERATVYRVFIETFVDIVFYDSAFLDEFSKRKDEVSTEEGQQTAPQKFISMMKNLMKKKINVADVRASLKMCFKIFLMSSAISLSRLKKKDALFDIFIKLCSLLGCKVDKTISISWKPSKNWNHTDSYVIISEMIDVLDRSSLSLTIDKGTYTLCSWFISLVVGTINVNLTNLSPELLTMVGRTFQFNPLIIENCLKCITGLMVCNKSSTTLVPYTSLMKTILDGATTSHRLEKLISIILSYLKMSVCSKSAQKGFENLTLNEIFPHDLSTHFASTVLMISNAQLLSTFKTILNHLQQDSLSMLESSCTDITVVVISEVICELLKQLLSNAKIADHSVPDIVKSKFNVLLDDLGMILEKALTILACDHNDRLLKSFLEVSHAFGAVRLIIQEYEGSPIQPTSKQDLVPSNFAYVHPYMSPHDWETIGSSIAQHEGCLAEQSLYNLMIQKIEALAPVEVGFEGPGTQTARYLLSISSPEYLWKELMTLAPLFQANEVAELVGTVIDYFGNKQDEWLEMIKVDEFVENRSLVLTLALQLLNKSVNVLNSKNRKLAKKVMKNISIVDLQEYELSLLTTEDPSLSEDIQQSIRTIKELINAELKLPNSDELKHGNCPDISFLRVLDSLTLHHFSPLSQTCLSLAITALMCNLPPNPEMDNLSLDIIFRMLNSPDRNSAKLFVSGLNAAALLQFFSVRGNTYPRLKDVFQFICKQSLWDNKTAKKLIKAVSNPTVETVWYTTMVMQAINQMKKKKNTAQNEHSDEDSESDEALDKEDSLDTLVCKVVPILNQEDPSLELLPSYSLILRLQLSRKKIYGEVNIEDKLEDYVKLCPLDPEQGVLLLETLVVFRSQLKNQTLQRTIALDSWRLLMKVNRQVKFVSKINAIFTSSNDEEFTSITTDLVAEVQTAVADSDFDKLSSLFEIWSPLLESMISYTKNKIRQDALVSLTKHITPLMLTWSKDPLTKSAEPLIKFFTHFAATTTIEMKPVILDTFLIALNKVPLPVDEPTVFLDRMHLAIQGLFSLYLFRNAAIVNRLHAYVPIYKLYLEKLAEVCLPDTPHLDKAYPCADKLESIAKTMIKRQKDFNRIAPYIICDVIAIFERRQLHSEIKLKYTNIVNAFLSLCDEHAIAFLSFALPPASQELFKAIHHNFKQYHKYVGKI